MACWLPNKHKYAKIKKKLGLWTIGAQTSGSNFHHQELHFQNFFFYNSKFFCLLFLWNGSTIVVFGLSSNFLNNTFSFSLDSSEQSFETGLTYSDIIYDPFPRSYKMTHGTLLCEQLTCFGPSFTALACLILFSVR